MMNERMHKFMNEPKSQQQQQQEQYNENNRQDNNNCRRDAEREQALLEAPALLLTGARGRHRLPVTGSSCSLHVHLTKHFLSTAKGDVGRKSVGQIL